MDGYTKEKNQERLTEALSVILVGGFLLWIVWSLFSGFIGHFWGTKEIGALFEAPRPYEAKYYVYLFPDGGKAKNYKVIADIEVDSICVDDGEGNSGCYDAYYLKKAYFTNGGYVEFDECDIAEPNPYCNDMHDEWWDIEFHKELVR